MESPCLSGSDNLNLLLSKVDTLVDGSIREFLDTVSITVASTMVPNESLHVAELLSESDKSHKLKEKWYVISIIRWNSGRN